MWGKNKKISELVSSLSYSIDTDDLNYIQSCYTTREDNILHLRIYLMQTIESNQNSTSSNARTSVFNNTTSSNELRTICASLTSLEKYRSSHEDALASKYQHHTKSKSSHGTNSTGIKALAFKIFSKLHKLNMAYIAKIQVYFPRLYDAIFSEQLALNTSLKEAAAQLIASPGLTLGKVFEIIAKTGRARLAKEIQKLTNYSPSAYPNLTNERSKNNKNERFYTEKLLQGLESFTYVIALQKKFYLRQKPIYPTLLPNKHHNQTNSLLNEITTQDPKLPALALPRYSLQTLNSNTIQLYDDILMIDKKKAADGTSISTNCNNNTTTSSSNQNNNNTNNNNNNGTTTNSIHTKEYESIFEVILSNYEKHLKEWTHWNKYINFKIKAYSQYALAKHQPITHRHPLYAKTNPTHRIARQQPPSLFSTTLSPPVANAFTNNNNNNNNRRMIPSLQPQPSMTTSMSSSSTIRLTQQSSNKLQEQSAQNSDSIRINQNLIPQPQQQTAIPVNPQAPNSIQQPISKKFIMPTAPISFTSTINALTIAPTQQTLNSNATTIGINLPDPKQAPPRSSSQSTKKSNLIYLSQSPKTRLPTFSKQGNEENDSTLNNQDTTAAAAPVLPPTSILPSQQQQQRPQQQRVSSPTTITTTRQSDFLNQYQQSYFRPEPPSFRRTSQSSFRSSLNLQQPHLQPQQQQQHHMHSHHQSTSSLPIQPRYKDIPGKQFHVKIPSLENLEIIEDPSEISLPPNMTNDEITIKSVISGGTNSISTCAPSTAVSSTQKGSIILQQQQQHHSSHQNSLSYLDSSEFHFASSIAAASQQSQQQSIASHARLSAASFTQFQHFNPSLTMQLQLQNLQLQQQQQHQLLMHSRGLNPSNQQQQQLQQQASLQLPHTASSQALHRKSKRLSHIEDSETIQKIIQNSFLAKHHPSSSDQHFQSHNQQQVLTPQPLNSSSQWQQASQFFMPAPRIEFQQQPNHPRTENNRFFQNESFLHARVSFSQPLNPIASNRSAIAPTTLKSNAGSLVFQPQQQQQPTNDLSQNQTHIQSINMDQSSNSITGNHGRHFSRTKQQQQQQQQSQQMPQQQQNAASIVTQQKQARYHMQQQQQQIDRSSNTISRQPEQDFSQFEVFISEQPRDQNLTHELKRSAQIAQQSREINRVHFENNPQIPHTNSNNLLQQTSNNFATNSILNNQNTNKVSIIKSANQDESLSKKPRSSFTTKKPLGLQLMHASASMHSADFRSPSTSQTTHYAHAPPSRENQQQQQQYLSNDAERQYAANTQEAKTHSQSLKNFVISPPKKIHPILPTPDLSLQQTIFATSQKTSSNQ